MRFTPPAFLRDEFELALAPDRSGSARGPAPAVIVRRHLRRPMNLLFLAIALIEFSVAWPTLPINLDVPTALLPIFAAIAALPLALGWAHPQLAWTVSALGAVIIPILFNPVGQGYEWEVQVVHLITFLVLTHLVWLRCPFNIAAPVLVGAVALFYWFAPAEAATGWAVGLTFSFVIVRLLLMLRRSNRELEQQTEVSEGERARRAVLEERSRIARDLHDVVAHRMSLVVVQAETAQYRIPDVSPLAQKEFVAIAGVAREALNEVRGLLGVLRLEHQGADLAPAPALSDIDSLVDGARGAGLTVEYLPAAASVPELLALTAYRIVQESLANAVRHAPGSIIGVHLLVGANELIVRVTNGPGTGAPDAGQHGGNGIAGMTERARSVDGTLTAIGDRHGFSVNAVLPLTPFAGAAVSRDPSGR